MMRQFCTADEIATALVAAARIEGECPIANAEGVYGLRARWFAMAALFDLFPQCEMCQIARGCGVSRASAMNARAQITSHRRKRTSWWDETKVGAVKTALAAAGYGQSAAPPAPPPQSPSRSRSDAPTEKGPLKDDKPLPPPRSVSPVRRAMTESDKELNRLLFGDPGGSSLRQLRGDPISNLLE